MDLSCNYKVASLKLARNVCKIHMLGDRRLEERKLHTFVFVSYFREIEKNFFAIYGIKRWILTIFVMIKPLITHAPQFFFSSKLPYFTDH